jgi:hypothetical protein
LRDDNGILKNWNELSLIKKDDIFQHYFGRKPKSEELTEKTIINIDLEEAKGSENEILSSSKKSGKAKNGVDEVAQESMVSVRNLFSDNSDETKIIRDERMNNLSNSYVSLQDREVAESLNSLKQTLETTSNKKILNQAREVFNILGKAREYLKSDVSKSEKEKLNSTIQKDSNNLQKKLKQSNQTKSITNVSETESSVKKNTSTKEGN